MGNRALRKPRPTYSTGISFMPGTLYVVGTPIGNLEDISLRALRTLKEVDPIAPGVSVVPIPGPNAALSALVVAGLPTGRFVFEGFPPRTKSDRKTFFSRLQTTDRTIILYESPQRIEATLTDLYKALGDRPIALGRELTKLFEEVFRGSVSGALRHMAEHKPRGEFTIVIGPATETPDEVAPDPQSALEVAIRSGATSRDAVQMVSAQLGL